MGSLVWGPVGYGASSSHSFSSCPPSPRQNLSAMVVFKIGLSPWRRGHWARNVATAAQMDGGPFSK